MTIKLFHMLLLFLTLNLHGAESCYTIQILSATNTQKSLEILQSKVYPKECLIMDLESALSVRCGCYETIEVAKSKLPELQTTYHKAFIRSTDKSRFEDIEVKNDAVEEIAITDLDNKDDNKTLQEPTVATSIVALIKDSISPKTKVIAESKPPLHLSEDPLFRANREGGLSIYEAILRAIEQSSKLGAAVEVVIQEKEKKVEAQAGHLPTVDLSGDTGYEKRQATADPLSTGVPSALTQQFSYKKTDLYLTITENLWSGGSIENSVDEKDANLKAALFDYRDKLEVLVLDVANAYFNVVYAEIALKISKKNMKSYEKILNIVTIKEKSGAATKGDVNFIRANVENAKTELVQKEKDLIDSISKYVYLLQTETKDDMPYEIESPLYITDLNKSLHDADAYNAKLLIQRSYIKATKFGFLSTQRSFHPKIDFTVNGESRNEFDVGLGQREKVNALLTFNYNLYNGGRDEATAIRLLAKMKEQKYLYQDIERNLIFEVKVLNSSVSSLNQSLKLTESEVLAARKVVDSYWIAFQHGTQDLQALQLAQRNLNTAEQSYAKYKKDLILNNYTLMKKTGALLKFLELPYKKKASEFKGNLEIFNEFSSLE